MYETHSVLSNRGGIGALIYRTKRCGSGRDAEAARSNGFWGGATAVLATRYLASGEFWLRVVQQSIGGATLYRRVAYIDPARVPDTGCLSFVARRHR